MTNNASFLKSESRYRFIQSLTDFNCSIRNRLYQKAPQSLKRSVLHVRIVCLCVEAIAAVNYMSSGLSRNAERIFIEPRIVCNINTNFLIIMTASTRQGSVAAAEPCNSVLQNMQLVTPQ